MEELERLEFANNNLHSENNFLKVQLAQCQGDFGKLRDKYQQLVKEVKDSKLKSDKSEIEISTRDMSLISYDQTAN